jgi:hypothetical protein
MTAQSEDQIEAMSHIVDALVFAVAYVEGRTEMAPESLHDDVKALESIASTLNDCSPAEFEALAASAERAHREHIAMFGGSQSPFERWMEMVFGPPWTKNRREQVPNAE